LQNSTGTNGDNLNNVRHETCRTFRNNLREYLKEKIMILKQTVGTKISDLQIGINEFKKGYHHRTKFAKHENSDLLADSHNISNK
jgi:methionine synthase I (cobalamin-dependent)